MLLPSDTKVSPSLRYVVDLLINNENVNIHIQVSIFREQLTDHVNEFYDISTVNYNPFPENSMC